MKRDDNEKILKIRVLSSLTQFIIVNKRVNLVCVMQTNNSYILTNFASINYFVEINLNFFICNIVEHEVFCFRYKYKDRKLLFSTDVP